MARATCLLWHDGDVGVRVSIAPDLVEESKVGEDARLDDPWVTIVWNDPVNLISYVVFVFQRVFGYSKEKATALTYDVHLKGKAVVSTGSREQMEADVTRLHTFGLWATVARG